MAKSMLTAYGSVAPTATSTKFYPVVGPVTVDTGVDANEDRVETPLRDAGTCRNLFVYVSLNSATTGSRTLTLRKSRVNTSVAVTYNFGETGVKEDTTNSAAFAATDEVNYTSTGNDSGGSLTYRIIGIEFDPDTAGNSITKLLVGGTDLTLSTDSVTRYYVPNALGAGAATTEADVKWRVPIACTMSDLWVFLTSNGRTTNTTFRSRKNGADGAQSVVYASGESGAKEDTTNSDSLAAGDDFNFSFSTLTGGGSIVLTQISTTCISTAGQFPMLAGNSLGTGFGVGATNYTGSGRLFSALDVQSRLYPRFDFTAKNLGVYVLTNTLDVTGTVTVRDNVADTTITVSYTAAETGLKQDTTNSATITGGSDEINYQVSIPAGTGALTPTWIASIGETAAAVDFPWDRMCSRISPAFVPPAAVAY
jgi:hypothetical protein